MRFDGPAQQVSSRIFAAVQEKKFLVCWDESDVKLQKLVRKSFDQEGEIVSLITDRKLGEQCCLIFASGTMALLTPGDAKFTQSLKLVEEGYMVHSVCQGKRTQNDIGVFALASKESLLSGQYTLFVALCVHSAHDGTTLKKFGSHKLPTVRPNQVITTFAFETASQHLSVLWDDGLLEFYRIPHGPQGLAASDSLQLVHSLPLSVYHSQLPSKKSTPKPSKKGSKPTLDNLRSDIGSSGHALTSLSDGYVILGGRRTEKDSQNCLLTIWDLRYGLVQLQKDLDLVEIISNHATGALPTQTSKHASKSQNEGGSIFLRQAAFSADKNVVLLNFGQVVLACPVYVEPSSLAQALGARENTNQFISPAASVQTPTSHQFDYLSRSKAPVRAKGMNAGFLKVTQSEFDEVVTEKLDEETMAINQLSDHSKTPDYTSFMEVFNSYVASATKAAQREVLAHEIDFSTKSGRGGQATRNRPKKWKNLQEYTDHENEKQAKAHMKHRLETHVDFSPAFIQSVVARCLQEDYLWLPLCRLIESRCVSVKLNPNLLAVLKRNNRIDLLSAALQFVSDISELEIVGIVRWLVNDVDQATLQIFIDEHVHQRNQPKSSSATMDLDAARSSESSPTTASQSAMDVFFNAIVNMNLDPLFLQYCMQLLTLKEIVAVLKFLLGWFELSSTLTDSAESHPHDNHFSRPSLGKVVTWANALIDSHLAELILVPDCARLLRRLHNAISSTIELCDGMQDLRGCLVNYFDHDPSPRDSGSDYSIELLRL